MSPDGSSPRIGLALGGGGARGLSHLDVLEAFDDLGVRPAAIAGASIGSLFGAGYAAGFSARELRDHTSEMLRRRSAVIGKMLKARVGRLTDLFSAGSRNPAQLDAELLIGLFLPPFMPLRFEDLSTQFIAVATDFFEHAAVCYEEGTLLPVIAASSAIPGLFRPVIHQGRTLIDGAMTNPLPYDLLAGRVDTVIAVDVTGGPVTSGRAFPNAVETMLGATQILQATIVRSMLARKAPDALILPDVRGITLLDFFKTSGGLRTNEATKDRAKHAIERLMAPA